MPSIAEDLTDGSGGVFRDEVVRAGAADGASPPHGADCTVHYEGFLLNGQKFDSSRDREEAFTFKLGVGQVIEGWDVAVAAMRPGEVSVFTCRADYAYGWEGKPPKIPVDATLRFEIELISWAPAVKPVSDMSPAEKLAHGQKMREVGTPLLKAGEYEEAAASFEAAVESLSALHSMMSGSSVAPSAAGVEEATSALRACLLNLAQCQLKLARWKPAVASCARVLAIDPDNVKATYRRGLAHTELMEYSAALTDLRAACLLDPKSSEVRNAYAKAKEGFDAHRQLEKQSYGGLFGGDCGAEQDRVDVEWKVNDVM